MCIYSNCEPPEPSLRVAGLSHAPHALGRPSGVPSTAPADEAGGRGNLPIYALRIPGRLNVCPVSLREASRFYCEARDESGEGVSTFPHGEVWDGSLLVAFISYNGRVWAPEPWHPGMKPLIDVQVAA